jgi:hypothetical protein
MSGLRPISDESTKFSGIKTESNQRDGVRLVNILNCLAYDWTVKYERRVTWHDPKQDVIRC